MRSWPKENAFCLTWTDLVHRLWIIWPSCGYLKTRRSTSTFPCKVRLKLFSQQQEDGPLELNISCDNREYHCQFTKSHHPQTSVVHFFHPLLVFAVRLLLSLVLLVWPPQATASAQPVTVFNFTPDCGSYLPWFFQKYALIGHHPSVLLLSLPHQFTFHIQTLFRSSKGNSWTIFLLQTNFSKGKNKISLNLINF